jgi:hypothetical protein
MPYLYAEFDCNQMITKHVSLMGIPKILPQFLCHRTFEADAESDHGKPKREMSTFMACTSLLMLPHLNTKAATVHLPLFRLLLTRANSIRKRLSYESPTWSVHTPQASETRNVHFYGSRESFAVDAVYPQHQSNFRTSSDGAIVLFRSEFHSKSTKLRIFINT